MLAERLEYSWKWLQTLVLIYGHWIAYGISNVAHWIWQHRHFTIACVLDKVSNGLQCGLYHLPVLDDDEWCQNWRKRKGDVERET